MKASVVLVLVAHLLGAFCLPFSAFHDLFLLCNAPLSCHGYFVLAMRKVPNTLMQGHITINQHSQNLYSEQADCVVHISTFYHLQFIFAPQNYLTKPISEHLWENRLGIYIFFVLSFIHHSCLSHMLLFMNHSHILAC